MTEVLAGPRGWPLLGNIPDLARDPLAFFSGLRDRGDCVRWSLGPKRMLLLSDPDLTNELFVRQETDFFRDFLGWAMHHLVGAGIAVDTGPSWKRKRGIVQHAIHPRTLGPFGPEIVDTAAAHISSWQPGQRIDVGTEMTRLIRKITVRTLFGAGTSERDDLIGEAMSVAQHEVGLEFRGVTMLLPSWVRTPGRRRLRAAVEVIDDEIRRLLAEHRRTRRGDVLGALIAARDGQDALSDKELRDEAVSLFVGGHETTSATMTWLWYLLSSAPEVRALLDEELAAVVGDRLPTYADFGKLEWTRKIVKEALRLYPAVWVYGATNHADTTLGGYDVPARTNVWICSYAMHRDPRYFPDPDEFRPRRWDSPDVNAQAWVPFGKGPRVCVGARFALVVSTLVLATIAQRFRVNVVSGVAKPAPYLTLRPADPIEALVLGT